MDFPMSHCQLRKLIAFIALTVLFSTVYANASSSPDPATHASPNSQTRSANLTQSINVSIEQTNSLPSVEKWGRFEIELSNSSWNGNPFDLDLIGTFTHVDTGRTLKQLGFYAGDDIWKIYFMPDQVGEWKYLTDSSDPDLDGHSGTFQSDPSNLPGMLSASNNRWTLSEEPEVIAPMMLPTREWFKRTNTQDGVDKFIEWADITAGARIIGTTLVYFHHDQDEVPYIKGSEGIEFNIPMWDRLNEHFDLMRDRGMGHYIMLYSDDSESPSANGIEPQSQEEMRLFRYVIARFSAYPIVIWDTGIDISEYRSNSWIDWHTAWFQEHDAWSHPVSSRTGGGSGGKFPSGAPYYSDGASTLPDQSSLISIYQDRSVPTAFTDRWREDGDRGNFDRTKIRQAAWETGLLGMAAYLTGNENEGYLTENYSTDFKAAPDLGILKEFFTNNLDGLENLTPAADLVSSGAGVLLVGQSGERYVAYDRDGGSFRIDLTTTNSTFQAEWFNPRSGNTLKSDYVSGGAEVSFDTPTSDDWVLHLRRSTIPTQIFEDVPPEHWAFDYTNALYEAGFVAGCSVDPLLYCPDNILNRAESSVFVLRGQHGAISDPPYPPPDEPTFADVIKSFWGYGWIESLWADGFTAGCNSDPLKYCPERQHSRAEGSVFFLRVKFGPNYEPPEPVGIFNDVSLDAWYAGWVEAAYHHGLLPACNGDPLNFCPGDELNRAWAAYMMVQAKGGLPLP